MDEAKPAGQERTRDLLNPTLSLARKFADYHEGDEDYY